MIRHRFQNDPLILSLAADFNTEFTPGGREQWICIGHDDHPYTRGYLYELCSRDKYSQLHGQNSPDYSTATETLSPATMITAMRIHIRIMLKAQLAPLR